MSRDVLLSIKGITCRIVNVSVFWRANLRGAGCDPGSCKQYCSLYSRRKCATASTGEDSPSSTELLQSYGLEQVFTRAFRQSVLMTDVALCAS